MTIRPKVIGVAAPLVFIRIVFGAYALVPPASVANLRTATASDMRAAAMRVADSQLDRMPHPMRHVHTEGTLPHQGIRDESAAAERDWTAARDLALAAALSGDPKYADASVKIIRAWLDVYRADFNPIDETNFAWLFIAYDLLPPQAKTPLEPDVQTFAKNFAKGYLDSMPGARGGTATNNWQSHRVKLATLAAYESGDIGLIKRSRAAFFKQLKQNIRPDGETIDFEKRDAIHYVVYDLEPLLMAALAAEMHGDDWYSMPASSGATIAGALNWLVPYADGSKTHREFVHSSVRFDYQRRDAGVPGFSGNFDPTNARNVFALAARLDSHFVPTAEKLQAHEAWIDLIWPLP